MTALGFSENHARAAGQRAWVDGICAVADKLARAERSQVRK